jgi:hypothetical protein
VKRGRVPLAWQVQGSGLSSEKLNQSCSEFRGQRLGLNHVCAWDRLGTLALTRQVGERGEGSR